jgi:hypothetical protein
MSEPQKNDAETVTHYMHLRERIEDLRLVLDIRYAAFVMVVGGNEFRFADLQMLEWFINGLEARG